MSGSGPLFADLCWTTVLEHKNPLLHHRYLSHPTLYPNETLSTGVRTRSLVGPSRPTLCPTVGVGVRGLSPPDPPWVFTRGQCSRVCYNHGVQALGVRPSTTRVHYTDVKSNGVPVRPSKTECPFRVKLENCVSYTSTIHTFDISFSYRFDTNPITLKCILTFSSVVPLSP